MSRFFHSASSSSSSDSNGGDSDDDSSLHESRLVQTRATLDTQTTSNTQSQALAHPGHQSTHGTSHRDILLHALLEERCQRQARDELGQAASVDQVDQLADLRYHRLANQLAARGFAEHGLDSTTFSSQRQAVRDGLDVLLHQSDTSLAAKTQSNVGSARQLRQIEAGMDALTLFGSSFELPRLPSLQTQLSFTDSLLLPGGSVLPTTPMALLNGSRYIREFEELGTLGRGGYGVVYHCKHRFDGLSYAVKKVPLSTRRLQRIRDQGQAEIDRLLLELTTLARLDHPNIVRYFGGWVEFTTLQKASNSDDAAFGASERSASVLSQSWDGRRIAEVDDDFIHFEDNSSQHSTSVISSDPTESLQRQSTRDTNATVSDDETESLDRSVSATNDHSTLSTFAEDASPCLALHIQMGLYPMTLADYISRNTTAVNMPQHCFHAEPSLLILSALIDGIVYLHSQGIVHRDLKPANVFLAKSQLRQQWCKKCSDRSVTNIVAYKVRIGDFGLVTQRDSEEVAPVGTELYRPDNNGERYRLESLDWFALGIIAFELFCPFSTRMERQQTLSVLKQGIFPHSFEQDFGDVATSIMSLITYLLYDSHAVDADKLQSIIRSGLATLSRVS